MLPPSAGPVFLGEREVTNVSVPQLNAGLCLSGGALALELRDFFLRFEVLWVELRSPSAMLALLRNESLSFPKT